MEPNLPPKEKLIEPNLWNLSNLTRTYGTVLSSPQTYGTYRTEPMEPNLPPNLWNLSNLTRTYRT